MTWKKLVVKQGESDITGETNFSERNWGKVSHDNVYSAKKLQNVSKSYVFTMAQHLAKNMASHNAEDQLATSEAQPEEAPFGCRALLVDII